MEEKIVIKNYKDVPILSISLQSTLANKTGAWRYLRPSYVRLQAPCSKGCPIGQDISFYLTSLADGKPEEAWRKILETNPFPSVCGRVCHHPCEIDCNRKEYDGALAIHALERFLGDWGMKEGKGNNPKKEKKGEQVAVVGGGPSGLSCAYFLAKKGYGVKVLEAMPQPGGMLRYGIPAYRLPRGILNREIERIESLGVKIETGKRLGQDFGLEDLKSFGAIFVATGAWSETKPRISGEELKGIWHGLTFLGDVNAGKRLSLGKKVVVVGGGNTAIDSARVARRLGSEVTLLYRRVRDDMPAIPGEVEEAEKEGVRFLFQTLPIQAAGKNGKIQTVECLKTKLGKPDESGRRTPIPVKGSNFSLKADTLVLAVGERPDVSSLPENMVAGNGRIAIDAAGRTRTPAVFAGGDAATGEGFVSSAIASGRKGAEAIDRFLCGELSRAEEACPRIARFADINLDYFPPAARVQISSLMAEKRKRGFLEVHKGLSAAKAQKEAERCFSCGNCIQCNVCLMVCPDVAISFQEKENQYAIDLDHCKGCGICSVECPRAAMTLEEEQWKE